MGRLRERNNPLIPIPAVSHGVYTGEDKEKQDINIVVSKHIRCDSSTSRAYRNWNKQKVAKYRADFVEMVTARFYIPHGPRLLSLLFFCTKESISKDKNTEN